jgi:hypothetical protein
MSILRMSDNLNRSKPWRAKYGGEVKYFETEDAAKIWEDGQKLIHVKTLTHSIWSKQTVAELIKKVMEHKTLSRFDRYHCKPLLERPIAGVTLAKLDRYHVMDYLNQRQKEESIRGKPVTGGTIRRELVTLAGFFTYARKNWRDYKDLRLPPPRTAFPNRFISPSLM